MVSRETITPPDIEQLRLKYSELEGSSRGSEFQDFLQNYCVQRKTYTNFDRSDGILDRNLFPEPPRKMDTPVQDDAVADTGRYQEILPTSFPLMPAQISTVLGEQHSNNLMGIVPDQLDISSERGDHVPDVLPVPATSDTTPVMQGASTSSLEDLPEPPTLKRKRSSPPSATPGEQSQLLSRLTSLGKKVVETAESQTADLKGKLSKLEDMVEANCVQVQQYSKTLAMLLQKDTGKVVDTVNLIQKSPQAPTVSQEMLKALLTLSQEAVKIYGSPYQPVEVKR